MNGESFLPIDFINRMESELGSDFHAFLRSYDEDKISALRLNPIKMNDDTKNQLKNIIEEQVPWCNTGYYYDDDKRPGLHPYHAAGVFYIQDASAQLPVEMLDPKPGDFVLDLCAAPGGKSTQIAGKLMGDGLLVSNEPMKPRAKILSENIERLGIRNAIVTSEFPDKLEKHFNEYFDKILVDAPCSGEGMFRKNHDAANEWSLENVDMCAARQKEILECAYNMLIPGGSMCYSTCTFSKQEDEECIAEFLSRHDDVTLIEERRLWPHKVKGEGHYAALLKKTDDGRNTILREKRIGKFNNYSDSKKLKDYLTFAKAVLRDEIPGELYLNDDLLYLLPANSPSLKGIHVIRGGLFLGTLKKNRFEPSHALALALTNNEVKTTFNITSENNGALNYLRGQSLSAQIADGWTLITIDGYSLGWGKAVNGQIKNHYPKGLRILG